jgi:hypothetical protein
MKYRISTHPKDYQSCPIYRIKLIKWRKREEIKENLREMGESRE